MANNVNIISASISDIGTISRLAREIWPVAFAEILSTEQLEYMLELFYSAESLTEQMTEKGHKFFIPIIDDQSVGFISLEADHNGHSKTKIHKIYLLPSTQGLGVGRKLMLFAERFATDKGNLALTLNVNRHNKAKNFYEKLGFRVILDEDISIGSGYLMEDHVMEKNIE